MDYQKVRFGFKAVFSILFLVVVFAVALSVGLSKQEKVECITWQNQAKEYPDFYITDWQDKQCRANGIIIDADIK